MIKQHQGMSEEDILESLAQQGIELMNNFKDMIMQEEGNQLLVRKLIEKLGHKRLILRCLNYSPLNNSSDGV